MIMKQFTGLSKFVFLDGTAINLKFWFKKALLIFDVIYSVLRRLITTSHFANLVKRTKSLIFNSKPVNGCALGLFLAVLTFSFVPDVVAEKVKKKKQTLEEFYAEAPVKFPQRPETLDLKKEQPMFVTASTGMRILYSVDDGVTWTESCFATEEVGDGWHGPYAVWGVAYERGLFSVYSGWGSEGFWLGSTNGKDWFHLHGNEQKVSHKAMYGNGVPGLLYNGTAYTVQTSTDLGKTWNVYSLRTLNLKTHHLRCAYGEVKGVNYLVAVGDGPVGAYSTDMGKTFQVSQMEGVFKKKFQVKGRMVYGNEVFLLHAGDFDKNSVARSADGGATWEKVVTGDDLKLGMRGLSFVHGEFWLTGDKPRASKDGLEWRALPENTPKGMMSVSDTGTIVCVSGNTISRSVDKGKSWTVVYEKPSSKTQFFNHVAFGYGNKP